MTMALGARMTWWLWARKSSVDFLVGWVKEDEVHGAGVLDHAIEELADASVFNGVAALQLERGDVSADGERGFRFAFGEPDEVRAAAEGFDADGA
jgi:hypothetical protein